MLSLLSSTTLTAVSGCGCGWRFLETLGSHVAVAVRRAMSSSSSLLGVSHHSQGTAAAAHQIQQLVCLRTCRRQ